MKRLHAHILFLVLLLAGLFPLASQEAAGRKVRVKLNATTPASKGKEKRNGSKEKEKANDVVRIPVDSCMTFSVGKDSVTTFDPSGISFSGYDKQATSRQESFHIVNRSPFTLQRAKLRLIYLDMQGRMLHSRDVTVNCNVPPGETRKTDIATWDTQSSFYYYLSNEPRRVASPYKVELKPLVYWISVNSTSSPPSVSHP